jgi:serine/threonine protein kinase
MRVVISVAAGPAAGKTFEFDQPDVFLFGRAKDARISLPDDPFVSRQHFLLEICPPHCRVTDLESKNGTFVDGLRYGGRKPLEPGARQAPDGAISVMLSRTGEISVGDTKLRVSVEAGDSSSAGLATVAMNPEDDTRTLHDDADALLIKTIIEESAPPPPAAAPAPVQAKAPPPQVISIPPAPGTPAARQKRNSFEQEPPAVNTGVPTLRDLPLRPKDKTVHDPFSSENLDSEFSDLLPAGEKKERPNYPGYKVERILGRGGMGIVYQAMQTSTGRRVAIKALLPNRQVSFNNFRTFHREIDVTRQLKHPNIVEMIDAGSVKGSYFCVLEFVDGMDLRALTKSKGNKLPLQELAPIMLASLQGLAYAHRAKILTGAKNTGKATIGVVHRDLKPENILLQRAEGGWIAKVADFGLAKSFESAGMSDMTMDGVCGTPIYWPREQLTQYRYLHPATDVFSIASVFYEILTGQWARPGLREVYDKCKRRGIAPGMADFMRVIGGNPIPPIRKIDPSIPAPVAAVLDRALQEVEVPSDQLEMRDTLQRLRYDDAGAFHDELATALKFAGVIG